MRFQIKRAGPFFAGVIIHRFEIKLKGTERRKGFSHRVKRGKVRRREGWKHPILRGALKSSIQQPLGKAGMGRRAPRRFARFGWGNREWKSR